MLLILFGLIHVPDRFCKIQKRFFRQIICRRNRCFHRSLLQRKHTVIVSIRDNSIPAATILAFMPVNAGIAQTGIFVSFKLINSIVHQRIIEHTERYQQLKIFDIQTRYFLKKPRFQLCDNILKAVFTIICQIHKHRNTSSKLDQLFLYFFALILKSVLLDFKGTLTVEACAVGVTFVLLVGAAQFSGNVLRRPNVSIFLSLMMAYVYDLTVLRGGRPRFGKGKIAGKRAEEGE